MSWSATTRGQHYFITHSGVVVAAIFLAFGLGLTAHSHAVLRVFTATAAWAAVAAAGKRAGLLDIPFRRRRALWRSGTSAGGAGTVLPDG